MPSCGPSRSSTQFLEAWQDEFQPHVRTEAAVLRAGFAQAVPANDPLIVRALTEHGALRRAVRLIPLRLSPASDLNSGVLHHAWNRRQQLLDPYRHRLDARLARQDLLGDARG
jgi:hypothetical protein